MERKKELAVLREDLARAEEAVLDGLYVGEYGTDWHEHVLTGQDASPAPARAVGINKKMVTLRKRTAGYLAFVVSPSPEHAQEAPDSLWTELLAIWTQMRHCEMFLEQTHKLEAMHEAYADLSQEPPRPVLPGPAGYAARCLMSVLALAMLRELEIKLAGQLEELPVGRIRGALSEAVIMATRFRPGTETLFRFAMYDLPVSRAGARRKAVAHKEDHDEDFELILNSLGLKVPEGQCSPANLLAGLGLRHSLGKYCIDPVIK